MQAAPAVNNPDRWQLIKEQGMQRVSRFGRRFVQMRGQRGTAGAPDRVARPAAASAIAVNRAVADAAGQ